MLPAAEPPIRLFNQPELAARKLQYLAARGFEIGNHTLWHADLSRYPEPVVRHQLAAAQDWIQRHVPGYRIRTLALPMGSYPRVLGWAAAGEAGGTRYRHDAILKVGGGPAPSPYAKAFDPHHLPRIQAIDSELEHWLGYFERRPEERYVSDGDPATVTVIRGTGPRVLAAGSARVVERQGGPRPVTASGR